MRFELTHSIRYLWWVISLSQQWLWEFFWLLTSQLEKISKQFFFWSSVSIRFSSLNFIFQEKSLPSFLATINLYCKIYFLYSSILYNKFWNIMICFAFSYFSCEFFVLQHSICIQIVLNVKLMRFSLWGMKTGDGRNRTMTVEAQIFGC